VRPPDFCRRPKAFHRIIVNPKFFREDFIAPHWRHKLIIRDPKLFIGDPSLSSQTPEVPHWRPKNERPCKLLIGDPSFHRRP